MKDVQLLDKYHGQKIINPNNSDKVFEIILGDDKVAFLTHIGNTWYPNTVYEVYVDGVFYFKLERILGKVSEPHELNPPIIFKKKILFQGINNDEDTHNFEIVVDGLMYKDMT